MQIKQLKEIRFNYINTDMLNHIRSSQDSKNSFFAEMISCFSSSVNGDESELIINLSKSCIITDSG